MRCLAALGTILTIMLATTFVFAERMVTLDDGRDVVLKDDGTWEYADEAGGDDTGEASSEEASSSAAVDKNATHFRKARWGMSQEDIKGLEGEPDQEEERMLMYRADLVGLDSAAGYIFVEDQLVRARYAVMESHTNDNKYLTDYTKLKTALTKKYGEPDEDRVRWHKDLYRDDPDHYGMAVSAGHLTLVSSWSQPETDITLILTGDNFDITLIVDYESKELSGLENELKDKEALDAL